MSARGSVNREPNRRTIFRSPGLYPLCSIHDDSTFVDVIIYSSKYMCSVLMLTICGIMLKFLAVKVSVLSSVPCFRNLQYFSSAVDQKYVPTWRNTFAETRMRMQLTDLGCRSYAKEVRRLDIEVQTDDIWTQLCQTNRLPVADVQNCKEIIKLLLSLHYHKIHIVRELSENTVLLKFQASRWKETVSDLQSYGFRGPHILPLLSGCHMLLYGTEWNSLQEVLIFLQSLQITGEKRLQIIARNPMILQYDDTRLLMNNYSNLLKVFTKNEVQMLIPKNPVLLTDPVEETNKKIEYMYNEMGIRSPEITRSRVFEHSLAHIITRHKFIERAGVYKMPDKHEIAAKEMKLQSVSTSANPSLSDLVDTSNATFVNSFCSMTAAEYKAFEMMMMEELHEEESEDDEDSDLSDSDSE